jgi:GntR family transcriptional regulator
MASALPLPKYHQIYLVLREQLEEGQFADGLPAELVLS